MPEEHERQRKDDKRHHREDDALHGVGQHRRPQSADRGVEYHHHSDDHHRQLKARQRQPQHRQADWSVKAQHRGHKQAEDVKSLADAHDRRENLRHGVKIRCGRRIPARQEFQRRVDPSPPPHLRKIKIADEIGPEGRREHQQGADAVLVGEARRGHEHEGGKPRHPVRHAREEPRNLPAAAEVVACALVLPRRVKSHPDHDPEIQRDQPVVEGVGGVERRHRFSTFGDRSLRIERPVLTNFELRIAIYDNFRRCAARRRDAHIHRPAIMRSRHAPAGS